MNVIAFSMMELDAALASLPSLPSLVAGELVDVEVR